MEGPLAHAVKVGSFDLQPLILHYLLDIIPRCKVEEREVKKCTPTSNTICEKLNPPLDSATESPETTRFNNNVAIIAGKM